MQQESRDYPQMKSSHNRLPQGNMYKTTLLETARQLSKVSMPTNLYKELIPLILRWGTLETNAVPARIAVAALFRWQQKMKEKRRTEEVVRCTYCQSVLLTASDLPASAFPERMRQRGKTPTKKRLKPEINLP
ncbi:hypothetical protein NDU88_004853 [Pleurodeles waltl]|uniref:Uncharacterized protein n=1 Tax=Pleurodeles waltl TaxID=8319 RepID=A0AAV7PGC8_PLEWA|nr:hypothetical protein NDU88_004853 [Pleurodeles waltl]